MKSNCPVNVEVVLKPNESADRLIKRFIKKCKKSDIIKEYLEKTIFRSPSQKKRYKKAKAKHQREKDLKKSERFTQ
jgi:ribosomal protein S21